MIASSTKSKKSRTKKKLAGNRVKKTLPNRKQMKQMMDKMFSDWKDSK